MDKGRVGQEGKWLADFDGGKTAIEKLGKIRVEKVPMLLCVISVDYGTRARADFNKLT